MEKFPKQWYEKAVKDLKKIRKNYVDWCTDYGLDLGTSRHDQNSVLDVFSKFELLAEAEISSIVLKEKKLKEADQRDDRWCHKCGACKLTGVAGIKNVCVDCIIKGLHKVFTELQIKLDYAHEVTDGNITDNMDPEVFDKAVTEVQRLYLLDQRSVVLLKALRPEWIKRTHEHSDKLWGRSFQEGSGI